MEKKIVLYTIHCARCKALEMKLNQMKVPFTIVDNPDTVVEVAKAHNLERAGAPILEIDGEFYDFFKAVEALKNLK